MAKKKVSAKSAKKRPAGKVRAVSLSKDIYRLMVEHAPTAKVLADRDGRILLVNKKTEALFGYRREELIGRPVEVLLPARFRTKHRGYRDAYAVDPQARAMGAGRDLYGLRKDGSEIPVEVGLNPIETPAAVYILSGIIDITERKRAENVIREVAADLAEAQRIATVGGFERSFLDPARGRWSAETFRIFGLEPSDDVPTTAKSISERIHPDDRAKVSDAIERGRTEGRNFDIEFRIIRPDGALRFVRSISHMVKGADGKVEKMVGTVQDITERHILERRLAHSETLASIGGMVAVVAHEIRNPLGSIIMAAKAMARAAELSEAERSQVVSVLVGESERLNATLGDFLQFARPRELQMVVGDLNEAVHETLQAAKSDPAIVGQAEVQEELDGRLPRIPFDASQIRQVLWNIIRNGFQAMDGRGRLRVRTEARATEIAVHIDDTGPGIPHDQLDKIFSPFYTTKPKGTGLGLPTSRTIVLAHGGDIRVESAPGSGSRFSIILPLPENVRSVN